METALRADMGAVYRPVLAPPVIGAQLTSAEADRGPFSL